MISPFLQRTIRSSVACEGVGLHSGEPVRLVLRPAGPDAGISFVRTDLSPEVEIAAKPENVVDTRLATTLGRGTNKIGTIEHLLSAVFARSLDNLRIEVDGPEVPIMDGSAAAFHGLLRDAGVQVLRKAAKLLVARKPIEVREGDRYVRLLPADHLSVSCTIDFDHPLIKDQQLHLSSKTWNYDRDIARARTFTLRKEVEGLRRAGLAKGGSLENAIVVDDFNILNPEGLRYPDEFVRHKILDLLGDLALCGARLSGHVVAHKSGHALHQALVRKLTAAENDAVERLEANQQPSIGMRIDRLPTFAFPKQA